MKGVDFSVRFDTPIPVKITSDETRLRQVLINVVGNAIKFTNRGSVVVAVSMTEPGHIGKLKFAVSDSGCGIAEGSRKAIFEPFTQGELDTSQRYGGTGLGLGLARKLAQKLGGDVVLAESTLNHGSVFEVTVDVGNLKDATWITAINQDQTESDSQLIKLPDRPVDPPGTSGQRLAGAHLLVVEDFIENQNLIRMILEREGATVEIADNGKIGVERALAQVFDVVIMDGRMPIMDGVEAVRLLRYLGYEKPIFAVSAHVLGPEIDKFMAAGCQDYVSKPINRPELIQKIEAQLAMASGTLRRNAISSEVVASIQSSISKSDPIFSLVELFILRVPGFLREGRQYLHNGDWSELESLGHKLKGIGGSYGFNDLTILGADLELAAAKRPCRS